jgi:uncharacterized protein YndB with AHSA1/START domain
MPWYEGVETVTVSAPPATVFETMTDFESMPEWQGPLRECVVESRDEHGNAIEVAYTISTPIRPVRYRLRHQSRKPDYVSGKLIDGDVKGFRGEWRFEATADGGTAVRCEMAIDPGFWVPKRVGSLLHETVLKRAVRDLKTHLEA